MSQLFGRLKTASQQAATDIQAACILAVVAIGLAATAIAAMPLIFLSNLFLPEDFGRPKKVSPLRQIGAKAVFSDA